ncbi:MAG: LysM peptidoglycan-binding domain-containing protein [Candidatus Stahlbacteria bacterium]|nr:MAG: LysM peptidoglycan-binding domain-containing protein [Candidatus Stahlbacteria bacterium]
MKKIISICFILFLLGPTLIFAEDKLTEEQAQEELLALQAQLEEAEAKIAELEAEVGALRLEVAELEASRDELISKLNELKEAWKICQYGRYKVIEDDWLSKIASMRKVYHEGSKWPMIYEANKDKIKNPNLIYPGWVLLIPYLDNYSVIPGDCLWLIASYLSIYSDAKKWPEVYEANKDKIKDPDLIYPKQEFVIPHD